MLVQQCSSKTNINTLRMCRGLPPHTYFVYSGTSLYTSSKTLHTYTSHTHRFIGYTSLICHSSHHPCLVWICHTSTSLHVHMLVKTMHAYSGELRICSFVPTLHTYFLQGLCIGRYIYKLHHLSCTLTIHVTYCRFSATRCNKFPHFGFQFLGIYLFCISCIIYADFLNLHKCQNHIHTYVQVHTYV